MKLKEYRVRYNLIDEVKHYFIEVKGLWGLMWADINITKPTPDREFIENQLKDLQVGQACLIDRKEFDEGR